MPLISMAIKKVLKTILDYAAGKSPEWQRRAAVVVGLVAIIGIGVFWRHEHRKNRIAELQALSNSQYQSMDHEGRVKTLDELIKLEPADLSYRVARGMELADMGEIPGALAEADGIEKVKAGDWHGTLLRCAVQVKAKKLQEAMESCRKAMDGAPVDKDKADGAIQLATAQFAAGAFTDAINSTNQALLLRPGFPYALLTRAEIYSVVGPKEKAVEALAAAVEAAPQAAIQSGLAKRIESPDFVPMLPEHIEYARRTALVLANTELIHLKKRRKFTSKIEELATVSSDPAKFMAVAKQVLVYNETRIATAGSTFSIMTKNSGPKHYLIEVTGNAKGYTLKPTRWDFGTYPEESFAAKAEPAAKAKPAKSAKAAKKSRRR